MNFIKPNHQLTPKGELLAKLNGYEQIPIINAIYGMKLANMTPVELAAAVGTMANINEKFETQYSKDNHNKKTIFYHENNKITQFVQSFDNSLQNFNLEIKKHIPDYRETELNTKVTSNLYDWASLNATSDDSVENWKKLYNENIGKTIKNEGSLFKEIAMTADLLKQMKLIAKTGMDISKDNYELQYYKTLYNNTEKALSLICRTPIEL